MSNISDSEMLGQRRAIDRNEGFPAPATVLVNELGNDSLPVPLS